MAVTNVSFDARRRALFGVAVTTILLLHPGLTVHAGPVTSPTSPAAPGLWSRATTLATFRGRWLDANRLTVFLTTERPDDVLGYFPRNTAVALTAVALETGFDPFLLA